MERSGAMVLRTKHAPSPSITFWRSRLVWSRARDWKSRNRQKRFKSSNLFFSATKMQSYATRRVAFFFSPQPCWHEFAGEKGKANMCSMVGLHLVAGDLRSKEMFVAMQRLTSSSPSIKTDK